MNLLEISKRGQEITSSLLHGGVNPDHIEMEALNVLSSEILNNLNIKENHDEIKKLMINMFFFGQLTKKI